MQGTNAASQETAGQIAIVGIGCRFPGGADDPQAFWRLLETGFNAVTEAPASRRIFVDLFDPDPKKPGRTYSKWGGFLEHLDLFDAPFFGISPREALHIDPQHRLLLELVWEACEDAGIPPPRLAGSRTGVFIGVSTRDYGDLQTYPQHRADIDMHTSTGTATSITANRISYVYDLRGPSVSVDTACSSALTAVHLACQSLRTGDCSVAIAGGVQMLLAPEVSIGFSKASLLSPSGLCRAFDAEGNGYVRGEGSGVVILKPLSQALAARDPIYAVIRATAVNQDGRTNGMTVPSAVAQQALIEEALAKAGIAPGDVQYVEAHGTGTPVGDPIEAAALGAALSRGRREGEVCAIGSVKTNIGHLEAASGMAGLIKTALALRHRRIPASLHFHSAPATIDLSALRLRVVTQSEEWPDPARPAIAGVNSFGFGGANAHVVVEEAPRRESVDEAEIAQARLLTLSAKTPEALRSLASAFAESLNHGTTPLRDVCYTAAERRAHHDYRLAITSAKKEDCATHLVDFVSGAANASIVSGRVAPGGSPKLAFVFSGMGPQWWGMGRQLRAAEPVFRRALEKCDAALRPHAGWSLLEELAADETRSRVAAPELAQVTNFAIQTALVELWASWGIAPDAVMGHSGGAMAAACTAGIYDLEDAIRLSYHRSRLQGRASNAGSMLAVGAPYPEIEALLAGSEHLVSLAAVNGPSAITLAGDGAALERIAAALRERQVFVRMLSVTIAYHSPAMDKIRDEFLASVPGLRGRAARIPFLSDTTGTWAAGEECDAQYWWRAIRQPVLFRDGIHQIVDSGVTNFVEIGPHPVLVSSILECMKERGVKGLALPSIRRAEEERMAMLRSLGALYTIGCAPNWPALREEPARVAELPHYPWQRERHWFEPSVKAAAWSETAGRGEGDHPLLGSRLRCARPVWENLAGAGSTEYLREHMVQGSPVCPGAGYVEMALAASGSVGEESQIVLRDVQFLRPMVLNREDATPIQFALDPEEGRFEVFSSSNHDATTWTCHARGSVTVRKRGKRERVDSDPALEQIAHAVSTEDFYARMAERGLVYGPVFLGIRSLWAANGEALGLITVDGLADCASYSIHPALLDAAFQVLVSAAEADPSLAIERRLFLPTSIREFRFFAAPGERFRAIARVTGSAGSTVTGDIHIAQEDGLVCAEISGLTAQLLDGAGHKRDSIDHWLYDYRWEPMPLDAAANLFGATRVPGSFPVSETALREVRLRADALSEQTGWRMYYSNVENRLNELAAAYIAEASLSLKTQAAEGWRQSLALQALANPALAGAASRAESTTLAAALLSDFPRHRLDVELLRRCGPHLADVVAGRADGRDILFGEDGFALLERFYRESPASAYYNALAADLIAGFASAFDEARPLRVLEVGAGTGGTTSAILPRLDARHTSYIYSDVSPMFLDRARTKFAGEYPFLSTRLFDITKDSDAFGAGSFDLIVAANVLHATPDVKPCVERLRALLAPGGALLLLEITSHPYWLDIVFGLMDGWWKFEDCERRPHHPLMPGRRWQSLLEECRFETATVVADTAPGEPAQSIVFGRRPTENAVEDTPAMKRWLLFADDGGVGARLASALAEHAIECTAIHAAEVDFPGLSETVARVHFEGIIHLWNLDATPPGETDADAHCFETAQRLGCASVISILQKLVSGTPLAERALVLVTAGAQATAPGEEPSLLQAPVWGMGRVVQKEWPKLRCRMADLSSGRTDAEIAALVREILSDDGNSDVWEEEVAFRGGDRFVHRLRPITLAGVADAAPTVEAGPEDKWRAEVSTTGSFDGIVLRRTARATPGPREVEIAVQAAALNFRDVVLTTGAVDGLETVDSFGQRNLGYDLAGIVTRCGEEVRRLRPGDAVYGVAPGSFASYALTHAALIAPRPSRINVEQAASIPVSFLTAHYALRHLARLAKGESVLIHVASGGVGLAAVQIARLCGARIFATAGSPAKRSYLESLGVTGVMDSRTLDFAAQIAERTGGRGVDVVLNSLSGEAMDAGVASLAPYGRFVELGKSDIYKNHCLQLLPFRRNLSFFSVDLDRLCYERPEFVGTVLREVADELTSGALVPPPLTEFPMNDLGEAMRFLAKAKHIGKVVVTNRAPAQVRDELPDRPPVRADATYLITGGLGGVGLLAARWLVERGARSLVLMGRSSPSIETEGRLEELRDRGARVEALAADVSNPADVERVLEFIRAQLPPLRGILHAAMVLADTPLTELDEAGLARVMAPKVAGAWNLHRQTIGESLDFFVSFSSIASLLGNPLQANYAAANAFLDSFAQYRRARGLPATTINWGVIAGSGYVARHKEIEEYLARQGYHSLSEKQALDVLGELLRHGAVGIMAARIDWRRLGDFAPRAAASARIAHLIPAEGGTVQRDGISIRVSLEGASAADRPALMERYLREQVARLLGAVPSAIDTQRSLTDLGLDSLIAAELTVVLERDLNIQIAGTGLLSGVSVRMLGQDLIRQLGLLAETAVETAAETAVKIPAEPAAAPPPAPIAVPEAPAPETKAEPPTPVPAPVANETDYGSLDYRAWSPGQRALRLVAKAGFGLLGRIETEGFENIPQHGPCLLATNHLSMADVPLILTLLPRRAIILANVRLKQNKFLHWCLSEVGQAIYVTPGQPDEQSLQRALAVLRAGGLLALGPEGTRSKTGGLLRGKTGVAYLATQIDVPVVPLAAWGQEKWRERGKRLGRIPIHVRVGTPIRFPQVPATPAAMRLCTDEIMASLASLLPAEYRGVYSMAEAAGVDVEMAGAAR